MARVHGKEHIERVKHRGLYEAATLAAGGAIAAAELALKGEPTFALIRPPGHHASANQGLGIMLSSITWPLQSSESGRKLNEFLIIDIDLHFGDGTVSIFRGDSQVKIVNPWSVDSNFDYLNMDEKDI